MAVRWIGGLEKGAAYYLQNYVFWTAPARAEDRHYRALTWAAWAAAAAVAAVIGVFVYLIWVY